MVALRTVLLACILWGAGVLETFGQQVIELKLGEDSLLSAGQLPGNWVRISPIQKSYDNTGKDAFDMGVISYRVEHFSSKKEISLREAAPSAGTWLIGRFEPDALPDTLRYSLPLTVVYPDRVWQIVQREDDSYLGYLTELQNLPFVLPPRLIPGYGHQVDLRQGCDCASFATYGRRRMGYSIPYRGPRGIVSYLDELDLQDSLHAGDIVHFGSQVSVFYEDVIPNGRLDPEDRFFQCYPHGPQICTFRDSGWFGVPFRLFRWKEDPAP